MSAASRSSGRRHPIDALCSSRSVCPADARNPSTNLDDVNEETVAWSALIEPGVRVNLEIAVSSDGEVHVVRYAVADVRDVGERSGSDVGGDGRRGDDEFGLSSSIGGSIAKNADPFAEPDGDGGGDDGDDDAVPSIHGADDTVWVARAKQVWVRKAQVRLTLKSEVAA